MDLCHRLGIARLLTAAQWNIGAWYVYLETTVIVTIVDKFEVLRYPQTVQAILERKGQAIVYGPPGAGKTFWAR